MNLFNKQNKFAHCDSNDKQFFGAGLQNMHVTNELGRDKLTR